MAPISTERRRAANRLAVTAPMVAEQDHFHRCPICGETVDRRKLGDVIHHEAPRHGPLCEAAD